MIAVLIVAAILVLCSVSDIKTREIGILMPPAIALVAIVDCLIRGRLAEGIVTSIVVFAVLMIISLVSKQAIGYGDVALLSACAVLMPAASVMLMVSSAMLIASVLTLAVIAVRRVKGKNTKEKLSVPFVPYITAGFLLTLI